MKFKDYDIKNISRIELDLTNFCNLNCPGCPTPQGKDKLDWDKVLPLIKYISTKNNINDITICGNGGEPTLHPNITQIILDLSIIFPATKITLATNGENLKYFNIDVLKHIGQRLLMEWSIDGHNQELHQITRVNGHLEKVLNNFKKYSIPFDNAVYTTRHKANENYIKEIRDFILAETNIETVFRDTTRVSKQDNLFHPTKHSINGNVKILNPINKFNFSFEQLRIIYSIKPEFNFYFNPDGRLYPCAAFYYNTIPIPELNIYNLTPEEAYKQFASFSNSYCNFHCSNKDADHSRCCLECGIDSTFKFDSYQDILNLK